MLNAEQKRDTLIVLGIELNRIHDLDILLERVLTRARQFVNADAGSIYDEAAAIIALTHHEKWDGTGYPGQVDLVTGEPEFGSGTRTASARPGKKGEETPLLFGRIVAIADVYDALSSRRSYKEPWDEPRSIDIICQGAGTHFDPELAEFFVSRLPFIRIIQSRYQEPAPPGPFPSRRDQDD